MPVVLASRLVLRLVGGNELFETTMSGVDAWTRNKGTLRVERSVSAIDGMRRTAAHLVLVREEIFQVENCLAIKRTTTPHLQVRHDAFDYSAASPDDALDRDRLLVSPAGAPCCRIEALYRE